MYYSSHHIILSVSLSDTVLIVRFVPCCQSVYGLLSVSLRSVVSMLTVCCQSAAYGLLSVGLQSVVSRLTVCCQSAYGLLSVGIQSAVASLSLVVCCLLRSTLLLLTGCPHDP